jgi:cation diffusion facilitator family transporter
MNILSDSNPPLTRFAWISIAAALVTIGLKSAAYLYTGSVGFLSDAAESLVNLVGALIALAMLTIASRPADEEHAFGHSKAEYFSSGIEGSLIVVAALSITYAAVRRLLNPQELEQVGLGLIVSTAASLVNLGVGLLMIRVGKNRSSMALEANGKHLMTDVWTSVGVILGVGAVALSGWNWLDPIVALLVAVNIVRTGSGIIRRSVGGLMDAGLPPDKQELIQAILEDFRGEGIEFHALRTRQAGSQAFASLHVLVPGGWPVQRGHALAEEVGSRLRKALPNLEVFTHLESLSDPTSWDDAGPDRPPSPQESPD